MNVEEKDLQEEIEDAPEVEGVTEDADAAEGIDDTDTADGDDALSESDDEFEYDEDGNVIIPEDDEPEIGEEEPDEESEEESEEESSEESEEAQASEPQPAVEAEKPSESEENEMLKKRIADYERQMKDTLKRYGYEGDDYLKGLAQIAADSSGQDLDEYLAEAKKAQDEIDAANATYEQIAKADLEVLKSEYPELASYKSLAEMPPDVLVRFANLRGKGLTAVEAYAAANPKGIRENAAAAAKKTVRADNKAHLKSNVPKGKNPTGDTIPPSVLKDWMDDFPKLTRKQVIDLYHQTNK